MIPTRVLSDEFHRVIDGRRVRAAVFLTFRFDPGFFELEVLPAFLDVPMSHVPELRLLNLAEALRQVDAIAVYYDRRALEAGSRSSKLDIQRVAVSHRTGYFHPKNVLVLVDNPPDHEAPQSLIVSSLSANLTRAGWWENVEVAHIEEIAQTELSSFRDDLLRLIQRVRRVAPPSPQPALDAIHGFVRQIGADPQRMRGGQILPRLFAGESVIEFLTEIAGSRLQRCNLEILSPYFDDAVLPTGPLKSLRAAFKPRETRIFLPRGFEGEALCSASYFEHVSAVATWGKLPKEVMRLSKSSARTVHAKVYRFFDPARRYEAFFVGSANLTSAALHAGGNVETGFFVETPAPKSRELKWWLEIEKSTPVSFEPVGEEESLPEGSGWRLSIRFDWERSAGECYWDAAAASPRILLLAHGVRLGELESLPPREWVQLTSDLVARLAEVLKSSAFLTARAEGEPDAEILVEEIGMTHKPSLMRTLSANDILRYWALLTPEQKKEFLEEHAGEIVDDPELAMWLGEARTPKNDASFFSTFADVYVSFGNLERTVRAALAEKREREAVDRLFGMKFDSLYRLIERVLDEAEGDGARAYVTLLCAGQLMYALERDAPEFASKHSEDFERLRQLLSRSGEVRERIRLEPEQEREQFFGWFDRWFLKRAEPIAEAAP